METESFESAWRTACECNVLLSPAEGKALYDRVIRRRRTWSKSAATLAGPR